MAITDQYEYVNEESISKILQCTICKSPLIDPVKTKCKPREHTFCQHCINDWLPHNSSGPSCRQNINIQDLTPITDVILLDMLNELPVRCLVCKKTGIERGNFDVHISKQCGKQNVVCYSADIKCPWTGSHKQLEEHLTTCPYTALRPMLTQIMSDERQLKEQVKEQQSLIDRLQKENQKFKEQLGQSKRPMPVPPTERRPPRDGTRPRESKSMYIKFYF
jgi:hypothetical protein